jgi:hypothetical protein
MSHITFIRLHTKHCPVCKIRTYSLCWKRCVFVVDFTVPSRICKKVTAVQGTRKTMKNLSMTASVNGEDSTQAYSTCKRTGRDLHSSWVSSPWCFQGTGMIWNDRKYSPYDIASHTMSMNVQRSRTICSVKERSSSNAAEKEYTMCTYVKTTYIKCDIGIPKGGGWGSVVVIVVIICHKLHWVTPTEQQ